MERAVLASAPWQTWILNVRAIYRWEKPKETGKWLALYTVLWYTGSTFFEQIRVGEKITNSTIEHIMGFLVGSYRLRIIELHSH